MWLTRTGRRASMVFLSGLAPASSSRPHRLPPSLAVGTGRCQEPCVHAGVLVHMGVLVRAGVLAHLVLAGKDGRGVAGNEPRPWRHQDTHPETDPQQHPAGLAAQGRRRAGPGHVPWGHTQPNPCLCCLLQEPPGWWCWWPPKGTQHLCVSFTKLLRLVK